MAKYKPGKSGVPTRKVKEIKKKISAEKGKTKSDKDRIADLEKQLAILLAKTQQETQGGKNFPSDADVKRAKMSLNPSYARDFSPEELEKLRNMKKNKPSARGPMYELPPRRKGGGKVYASQNKKYGGGIYPKRGK